LTVRSAPPNRLADMNGYEDDNEKWMEEIQMERISSAKAASE
jgi:hypothetical protein